jgi:hypothetical protein
MGSNTAEPKTGALKNKMSPFPELFEKISNVPSARIIKSAGDKPTRIQPLRQSAVEPGLTEADRQTESAGARTAAEETPAAAEIHDDSHETDKRRDQAELNHEIVKTLSEALLIPAELVLQTLVDLNIPPVMLEEQAVMEEFLQAVAPESLEAAGLSAAQGLFIETYGDDMIYDPSEGALVPAEAPEERITPEADGTIVPRSLSAAAARIVAGTARPETAARFEEPETEDAPAGDISTAYSETVIPVFEDSESEPEEDIGESWYSEEGGGIVFDGVQEKTEIIDQSFIVPQTESPDVPADAHVMSAPARLETGKSAELNEVIRQVTDGIKAESLGVGVSELKVTLKPESLGEVTLKLLSDNGILTARFTAENQRVKEIMESNFNSLHGSLSEQGIVISQLSVSVGERETPDRRFAYQTRRAASKITAMLDDSAGSEILSPLAAHDSRVSYTA